MGKLALFFPTPCSARILLQASTFSPGCPDRALDGGQESWPLALPPFSLLNAVSSLGPSLPFAGCYLLPLKNTRMLSGSRREPVILFREQSRQESVCRVPASLRQGRSSGFRLKHWELGHGADRAGMVSGFPELGVTAELPWNMRDFSLTHSSRAKTRRIRKATEMKVASDSSGLTIGMKNRAQFSPFQDEDLAVECRGWAGPSFSGKLVPIGSLYVQ